MVLELFIFAGGRGEIQAGNFKKNVSFQSKLSNKEPKSETRELELKNEVTYSVIEIDDLEPLVYACVFYPYIHYFFKSN